jgi:hypothetical protein
VGFLISIYFYFYRKKAKAYLVATCIRFFLIICMVVITDWEATISGETDIIGLYWCIGVLLTSVVTGLIMYKRYNQCWDYTITVWQEIGKVDLKRHMFRIFVPVFLMNKNGNKKIEKAFSVFLIVLVLLQVIRLFINEETEDFLFKFAPFFSACIFSTIFANYFSWLVNFSKMEKEMQVEFMTEYGDEKELARLSRRK